MFQLKAFRRAEADRIGVGAPNALGVAAEKAAVLEQPFHGKHFCICFSPEAVPICSLEFAVLDNTAQKLPHIHSQPSAPKYRCPYLHCRWLSIGPCVIRDKH